MTVPLVQTAFSAGEISPELYGEVDLKKYASSLTTARNGFINYKGGWKSRGGTALVGMSKQTTQAGALLPPRLVQFQFNINQGYVLEFGNQYLRFIFQGGYVLESGVAMTGATNAAPCQISVAGTPFALEDWVYISGVQGMTQLNGAIYRVAAPAAGHFNLHDINGNVVNSNTFGAYSGGGTIQRIYTISTPYAAADLAYLKFAETADKMSITCVNTVSLSEYPPYDLTRQAGNSWTLAQTNFGDVIQPPATLQVAGNQWIAPNSTAATFAWCVTAVDSKGNESVISQIKQAQGLDIQVQGGSFSLSWSLVPGAAYYNVYRTPPSVANVVTNSGTITGVTWYPVPDGSIMGLVGAAYGTSFTDTNPVPDLSKTPPTHQDPFARGQILSVNVIGQGSGLTAVNFTITTGTGGSFTGYPIVNAGQFDAFVITRPGAAYQPGDTIALNGAGFAGGSISFSGNPTNNQTITLNGVTITFVTNNNQALGANQVYIGGSEALTIQNLVVVLNGSANASLNVANYSTDLSGDLLINYGAAGTAGNSYTLAASSGGTVSGATLTGGSGSGFAGAAASGSYTFTGNPTAAQTIILNGVTWSFVAAGASGTQTNIQGNLAATLTQLVTDLTGSANSSIAQANYSATSTVLNIVFKTVGTAGNAYTLAAGTYGGTVSGPHLTGGLNASGNPSATLTVGPETGTYPGVNVYFQQRHFFANSLNNPDTFWASRTGLYNSMDTSIPVTATDAVTASPWTEQVNGIQWLIPMPGGLIAMSGSRAWQLLGEGSYQLNAQPITAATVQAQPQAFNGCSATVPPIVIDYDVLYVEAIGETVVRDLSWNFWVNIYTGADLTILSSHLFLYRKIIQWSWARNPHKVIWCVTSDGLLLSQTYLKEQEVYGWARHDTQGLFVSTCTVTEPPVDAPYFAVLRVTPNFPKGAYFIERMDNRLWQTVEDVYAVDSGVSNPPTYPNAAYPTETANLFASAATGAGVTFYADAALPHSFTSAAVGQILRMAGGIAQITGYTDSQNLVGQWLNPPPPGTSPLVLPYAPAASWSLSANVTSLNAPHLANMNVVGLADGVPIGGAGAPLFVGPSGVCNLGVTASNVKLGLPFIAQGQTPYLNGQQVAQGGRKAIPSATIRFSASGRCGFGTNQVDGGSQSPQLVAPVWNLSGAMDPMQPTGGQAPPVQYTSPGGLTVTPLWTGDIKATSGDAEWESKGQVAFQQILPLPLEVTAVMPDVLDGDVPERSYTAQQRSEEQRREKPGPGRWMIGGEHL